MTRGQPAESAGPVTRSRARMLSTPVEPKTAPVARRRGTATPTVDATPGDGSARCLDADFSAHDVAVDDQQREIEAGKHEAALAEQPAQDDSQGADQEKSVAPSPAPKPATPQLQPSNDCSVAAVAATTPPGHAAAVSSAAAAAMAFEEPRLPATPVPAAAVAHEASGVAPMAVTPAATPAEVCMSAAPDPLTGAQLPDGFSPMPTWSSGAYEAPLSACAPAPSTGAYNTPNAGCMTPDGAMGLPLSGEEGGADSGAAAATNAAGAAELLSFLSTPALVPGTAASAAGRGASFPSPILGVTAAVATATPVAPGGVAPQTPAADALPSLDGGAGGTRVGVGEMEAWLADGELDLPCSELEEDEGSEPEGLHEEEQLLNSQLTAAAATAEGAAGGDLLGADETMDDSATDGMMDGGAACAAGYEFDGGVVEMEVGEGRSVQASPEPSAPPLPSDALDAGAAGLQVLTPGVADSGAADLPVEPVEAEGVQGMALDECDAGDAPAAPAAAPAPAPVQLLPPSPELQPLASRTPAPGAGAKSALKSNLKSAQVPRSSKSARIVTPAPKSAVRAPSATPGGSFGPARRTPMVPADEGSPGRTPWPTKPKTRSSEGGGAAAPASAAPQAQLFAAPPPAQEAAGGAARAVSASPAAVSGGVTATPKAGASYATSAMARRSPGGPAPATPAAITKPVPATSPAPDAAVSANSERAGAANGAPAPPAGAARAAKLAKADAALQQREQAARRAEAPSPGGYATAAAERLAAVAAASACGVTRVVPSRLMAPTQSSMAKARHSGPGVAAAPRPRMKSVVVMPLESRAGAAQTDAKAARLLEKARKRATRSEAKPVPKMHEMRGGRSAAAPEASVDDTLQGQCDSDGEEEVEQRRWSAREEDTLTAALGALDVGQPRANGVAPLRGVPAPSGSHLVFDEEGNAQVAPHHQRTVLRGVPPPQGTITRFEDDDE